MRNRAVIVTTAGLAFGAGAGEMPASAEAQPQPNVPALNGEASQLMTQLGNKVLTLKKSAKDNRFADVETRAVGPNMTGVMVQYTAKRPSKKAELGTYTLTATFATKSRSKLNASTLVQAGISQNAGRGGPYASLDLRKDEAGNGYDFDGEYAHYKKGYTDSIEASTQPDASEQQLDSSNIRAIGTQALSLIKAAPKRKAITKLLRIPFAKKQPGAPAEQSPTTPAEQAFSPAIIPPVPTPEPAPKPVPEPEPTPTPEPEPEPGVDPYPAGSLGYDVSWPQCDTVVPTDRPFRIIGVQYGLGYSTNPCLAAQATAPASVKLSWYANTGWYDQSAHITLISPKNCAVTDKNCIAYNYGYNNGLHAWNSLVNAGVPEAKRKTTWTLDLEEENTWNADKVQNQNSLKGQEDALRASGATDVMIYSSRNAYKEILGSEYKPGNKFWLAIGHATLADAKVYCNPSVYTAPTGGRTELVQWVENNIDNNVAC